MCFINNLVIKKEKKPSRTELLPPSQTVRRTDHRRNMYQHSHNELIFHLKSIWFKQKAFGDWCNFRIWRCAYLLNVGVTKGRLSMTEAFNNKNLTPLKRYSTPSNPVFVVCCRLSLPRKHPSWLRSSLVYGPGGSSMSWWPPRRALDWGARGLRRSARFRSQLKWLMSLKNKIYHLKK